MKKRKITDVDLFIPCFIDQIYPQTGFNMVKLLEKAGFVKEGILREAKFSDGGYHDIIRYGILRNEWEKKKTA